MSNEEAPYITIEGRKIGRQYSPYVIAEVSANHNGSLEKALDIIAHAKSAGADAVKIQTYRPDTITLDCNKPDFKIKGGLWHGKTLYDLYEEAHTPWAWHEDLFSYAREIGITLFSSPFDNTAVDLLEKLNAPAYKIASFESVDLPLIRYVASTGKPMIISTGMINQCEIQEAIVTALNAGCKELAILHCVSGYPAPPADYNLSTISNMQEKFNKVVGLSDHTIGNATAIASIALGASIVEKHFTLDRNDKGPDSEFSIEPNELKQLTQDTKSVHLSLGQVNYGLKSSEMGNVVFKRSLYAIKDIAAGEQFTPSNIASIRPGYGLAPKYYDQIIGTHSAHAIQRGSPITEHVLSGITLE